MQRVADVLAGQRQASVGDLQGGQMAAVGEIAQRELAQLGVWSLFAGFFVDQDACWAQIAVNDIRRVYCRQRLGDFTHQAQALCRRDPCETSLRGRPFRQVAAGRIVHFQVVRRLVQLPVQYHGGVASSRQRLPQVAQHRGLAAQRLQVLFAAAEAERSPLAAGLLLGQPDLAERVAAQPSRQLPFRFAGDGHAGHERRSHLCLHLACRHRELIAAARDGADQRFVGVAIVQRAPQGMNGAVQAVFANQGVASPDQINDRLAEH